MGWPASRPHTRRVSLRSLRAQRPKKWALPRLPFRLAGSSHDLVRPIGGAGVGVCVLPASNIPDSPHHLLSMSRMHTGLCPSPPSALPHPTSLTRATPPFVTTFFLFLQSLRFPQAPSRSHPPWPLWCLVWLLSPTYPRVVDNRYCNENHRHFPK